MKTHTSQFKEQIKKFGRELDSKITYTLNNEEVVLGKEQLNAITPHYEGDILKSVMKQLDIDSNVEIPVGTEVNYKFGVLVNEEYEYLDYGNYIVYSSEKQEDTRSWKIICYDKMLYAMKDYERLEVEYPITLKNYLSALCTKINLTLKDTNFVNCDKQITNELYLDSSGNSLNYTYRDVLDEIAGATASTICINDDDELEVRYVQNVGTYTEVEGENLTLLNVDDKDDFTLSLKGQTNQNGTPTPSSPVPVETTTGRQVVSVSNGTTTNDYEINLGKNLLNIQDRSVTNSGLTATMSDGSVSISGTSTATSFLNVILDTLTLEKGTYTISAFNPVASSDSGMDLRITSTGGTTVKTRVYLNVANNKATFTLDEDLINGRVQVRASSGKTFDNFTLTPMIEKGAGTSYSPYKTPIYLGEMRNTNNVVIAKDYIFRNTTENPLYDSTLEEGQWYLHKEIGRVVLNGSEDGWDYNTSTQYPVAYRKINDKISSRGGVLSNYFSFNNGGWYVSPNNTITEKTNNNYIFIKSDVANTLANWKTWLSSNNVEVYYVLNTPTNTLIEDEELINQLNSIELLEGLNNVSVSSSDLGSVISLKYLKERDTIDEEYLKDINVNFGEKYGPVNSVVFSRSAESDNIYKKDVDSITENGLTEIKIIDNQILNSNNRFDFIDGVFNQLNGFEYYANDFSSTGIAYYDLCDRYNVRVDDNIYTCIMMNDELDVSQGLEEKVHLDIPEKSETDYKKADTTDRRINQAWLIVNKQESEIEGLVSKTSILDNGIYTKEQVDNLLIDTENGITNTFATTGGNNILRNTGLWFESGDSDNPYEFWNGKVVRVKEENAVNLNALSLQNTTLTQQQNVSNGMYTLSFKYKRKILTANASVIINGVGGLRLLDSDEIDKEAEVISNIELNTQYIEIGFVCDVDDGFYIYDLMLNSGKVKLSYSQNQNETTTDTVNISKGITITSSDTKTIFKADSTGIKTLDENGNRLTEFTDTGMVTKEATIENKSQIVGTLWQEVNNQTWITKL